MKKAAATIFLIGSLFLLKGQTGTEKGVVIQVDDVNQKAEVFIDGKFFTSYIYPSNLEKPVLFPLTTATGTLVTRGFPLQPRPGERVDHPHHVGWWMNYGDVNGLDFWNNSYAVPDSLQPFYGRIRHTTIIKAEGGEETGELTVICDWIDHQQQVLLQERTSFRFSGEPNRRCIVRKTDLTALQEVKLGDSKEGLCALRVDRAFEMPSDQAEFYIDADGSPTDVPVLNNDGVNGVYRSSEGREKDAVWGSRAKWVSLSAIKGGEQISIVLFDHPGNHNYPAYWHTRGYGLFALNNLGCKAYDADRQPCLHTLKKGEILTLQYMLLIQSGGFITDAEVNRLSAAFSRQ